MSAEVHLRVSGRAGRITLGRPGALNALAHAMVRAIDAALGDWAGDPQVQVVVIDAQGERAFCAGGDVSELYSAGRAGEFEAPRRFWREEYRMNARLAEFPKPVVSLMQGYTMGGGVGVGCHASHRVVGATSRIAMPEVSIGMLPDVGGSLLLARAPGRLGEYLALTATRMGPGDAIHAGFADYHAPEAAWPDLIARLEQTGDAEAVDAAATPTPDSPLAARQGGIDALFAGETLGDIVRTLRQDGGALAGEALAAMARHSPLAMACAVEVVHRMRGDWTIRHALAMEYRYSHRAMAQGDFLEGVRARIIDKDNAPRWRHRGIDAVPATDVAAMLMPLGAAALGWDAEEEDA